MPKRSRNFSSASPTPPARYSGWFLLVVVLFVTCLIVSNIIATKLVIFQGQVITAAIVIFPISYICGDVLTEVYGYRQARLAIWLGFLCNLIAVVAIWLGQQLPPAAFWDGQAAYERILGNTPRLLLASFLAYLVGELVNSFVLAKMKIATQGRWLWMRTIGSTIVGQGLDSLIFITVGFMGTIAPAAMLSAILTQWFAKTVYEAIATPLTYLVVNFLKQTEQLDVYDYETSFNPLGWLKSFPKTLD
jgi:uncharacterized integral membrane protein (TIGR00697 family)